MLLADIHLLHQSDFYRISDFRCFCNSCSTTKPEYNESFFLSFIRTGFFEYRTFRRIDELHAGRLLISKPGYEHITAHIDGQPDQVTVFEFPEKFFRALQDRYAGEAGWFLRNQDIHSMMLRSSPALDHLHKRILQATMDKPGSTLVIDELVMDLLEKAMKVIAGGPMNQPPLTPALKQFHLRTVENARDYLLGHFNEDVSLHQLARHCHVSPFHFSRIFRGIMHISPYQYLSALRLDHAKILLNTTDQPVMDIAFACGYNSIEHFATAFRGRFASSPSQYRKKATHCTLED